MQRFGVVLLAVAMVAGPVGAQEGVRPELSYSVALGTATAGGSLSPVFADGWSFRFGAEADLSGVAGGFAGKYVDLVADGVLNELTTGPGYGLYPDVLIGTALVGAKVAPATPVRPYVTAQVGYTSFTAKGISGIVLEDQPTVAAGAGLELTLGRLSAFTDIRWIRTLGGDSYRPVSIGARWNTGRIGARESANENPVGDVVGSYALEQMFGQPLPASREGTGECIGGGRMVSYSITSGSIVLSRDGTAFVRAMARARCELEDGRVASEEVPQDTRGTFSYSGEAVTIKIPDNPGMVLNYDATGGTLTWAEADSRWRRKAEL